MYLHVSCFLPPFVLSLKPPLDRHLSQRISDLNSFKDWKMGDENKNFGS